MDERATGRRDTTGGVLIPMRVTIETIFGCNAQCDMCPIDLPTRRKKGIMPLALFEHIIDLLLPYREQLQMMDLFCLGEPLLDPHIFDRIRYVKARGFRQVGISTNAQLLDAGKQRRLLESGIDNVICSIDGVRKETHESIRRRTSFERVVENTRSAIRMRDEGNYRTRFVIRFIRQEANRGEWEAFKACWREVISPERGDFITVYDAHNWGGLVGTEGASPRPAIRKPACRDIFEVLYILADGSVPLCSQDWLHPTFNFGNVRERSPLEIFNDRRLNRIRQLHLNGDRDQLPMCRVCACDESDERKELFA
jgi:MoaA/NifB/PqqE/SkfB family radical SAM enzyme